jgi:hypothetical protein
MHVIWFYPVVTFPVAATPRENISAIYRKHEYEFYIFISFLPRLGPTLSYRDERAGSCRTTRVYPSLGATRISSFCVRIRTKEMSSFGFVLDELSSPDSSPPSALVLVLPLWPERLWTYLLAVFIISVSSFGFPSTLLTVPEALSPTLLLALLRAAPADVICCVTMSPSLFRIVIARTPLWEASLDTVS